MNIIEAMRERRSVRSYVEEPLSESDFIEMREAIEKSYTIFGGKVSIRLKKFDIKGDYKPSTYGIIKGAKDYFLMALGKDEASQLSGGFRFEQIVLAACQKGLGTCWIGGTFKGSTFETGEAWAPGETLQIISPVGYPGKKRLLDSVVTRYIGAGKRKPFDELFFLPDLRSTPGQDCKFKEALEMLRLAPSSTNSQPWRVITDGSTVRFYYIDKSKFSLIDMGIGICHFYETEKFKGREGTFFKEDSYPGTPEKWKYLISYTSAG